MQKISRRDFLKVSGTAAAAGALAACGNSASSASTAGIAAASGAASEAAASSAPAAMVDLPTSGQNVVQTAVPDRRRTARHLERHGPQRHPHPLRIRSSAIKPSSGDWDIGWIGAPAAITGVLTYIESSPSPATIIPTRRSAVRTARLPRPQKAPSRRSKHRRRLEGPYHPGRQRHGLRCRHDGSCWTSSASPRTTSAL